MTFWSSLLILKRYNKQNSKLNIERLSRISLTTQTLIQADFHRGNHHFWAIKDKNTELNKSQELHVLLVIRKYCKTKNCSK